MRYIVITALLIIGFSDFTLGQTKLARDTASYSKAYQDSCAQIINAFSSPVDRYYISDYLSRFEMCRYLACWLETNHYSEEAKAHLMMAVNIINKDPEYIMERFIELYELLRSNPGALLQFQNERIPEETIEGELQKPEPLIRSSDK